MEILITVVAVLFSLAITAVVTLVSLAIPALVIFLVVRNLSKGGTLVVSGPLVDALASSAAPPRSHNESLVKRTRCPSCGAPKVRPSITAYVYCDYCGLLVDWDFQAAMADPRSKQPGPAYEAMVRRKQPELDRARASGDRQAYERAQIEIFDAYVSACPAACPPRIGDPRYRKRWVEWTARSQTLQDLDPTVHEAMTAMQAKVATLKWDRSNPFQPKVDPGSFAELLDAVMDHQRAGADLVEREGLLDSHPDPVTPQLMRRMGLSAMVQGWMGYLPPEEVSPLLAITGLEDEYDQVRPTSSLGGTCPHCSAPITAVQGAMRVLCEACGNMVGISEGTLPCHGCGAPVELPRFDDSFQCPSCDALLKRMSV